MKSLSRVICSLAFMSILNGYTPSLSAQSIPDKQTTEPVEEFTSDLVDELSTISSTDDSSEIPEELRDVSFDRYIDLLLLGEAWERLNPALMADVALQLAEGERVLLRKHKAFSAMELLNITVKIAIDRHDRETLERLQKYFEKVGDVAMVASLKATQKLAGETREIDPAFLISVEDTSYESYSVYREIIGEAKAAQYVDDRETIDALEAQIDRLAELSQKQKYHLRAIMNQSRDGMKKGASTKIARDLDMLMETSRGFPEMPSPPKLKVPIKELPKVGNKPGKFQQKVVVGTSVGAGSGAINGSVLGPAGTAAGAVGGAVVGGGAVVVENHANKRWSGNGLKNWDKPRRW